MFGCAADVDINEISLFRSLNWHLANDDYAWSITTDFHPYTISVAERLEL